MAGLKWATMYRFDDETNGYVVDTIDEEMEQGLLQLGEQVNLSKKDRLSDIEDEEDISS